MLYRALACLFVVACSAPHDAPISSPSRVEADAASLPTAAPPSTSEHFDAGAADASASNAGTCIHPAYQPATCIDPPGKLVAEAIVGWFADRGVKVAEGYPGYMAACHELVLGPQTEQVLVCTADDFAPGPEGANGPMGWHRDLRLLTVRNRKAFEIVRLPLGFTEANNWDADTLFIARYAIDRTAGTLDLIATAEECDGARKGVAAYHQRWADELAANDGMPPPFRRSQVNARLAQKRMDDAHLVKICKSAGHYLPVRGGHLERAK